MADLIIKPTDQALRGMMELHLHESVVRGLVAEGVLNGNTLDAADVARLEEWADALDNPMGQRAAIARMLAQFARVSNAIITSQDDTALARTFWDAVSG